MLENFIITQLTPEQEALIPVYQEKWRQIASNYKVRMPVLQEFIKIKTNVKDELCILNNPN